MCGIAGIYFSLERRKEPFSKLINTMTQTMHHRGPDAGGVFVEEKIGLGLGHRRLSIRDLSPLGAQPMHSSCGRFAIVYNGEIYNHKELEVELRANGRTPKGTSDTSILIEAIAQWGTKETLNKLVGMFAFAVFDKQLKILTIARDRIGIKPLYWGTCKGQYFFASELKPFDSIPYWKKTINRNALASFMRHNYIPAPLTIYENVFKLEAGSFLEIYPNQTHSIGKYWCLREKASRTQNQLLDNSETDILNLLDKTLSEAVSQRMVTDVPLGALLSGGIDSSLITALMAETSNSKISTFSIGFEDSDYNEAHYASAIANYLGTNHNELYVNSTHALDMVDKIPLWYDEPFADSSQLPTALVCELTKQHVSVVLSGDGGDELFAGYNRYPYGYEIWNQTQYSPKLTRKFISKLLRSIPASVYNKASKIAPKKYQINQLGDKVYKYAAAMVDNNCLDIYRNMLSHWQNPESLVLDSQEYKGILWDDSVLQDFPNFIECMQFLDTMTYLPDDILTKVDRASMAFSLEARVPLLDHRFVELAWKLPLSMKYRDGETKWALRQLLYKRIPKKLLDRPKMGFGIPLADWLRGPLKDWANELLDPSDANLQEYFNVSMIQEKWYAHLSGENWAYPLWNVLVFQSWLRANK